MHSNLLGSSLDVLQLVLRLHAHVLDLADRLVDVWDLSLLRSLDPLSSNLQSASRHNPQGRDTTKGHARDGVSLMLLLISSPTGNPRYTIS